MQLPHYLDMLTAAERTLADAHLSVADAHAADGDAAFTCRMFAREGRSRADALAALCDRYPVPSGPRPERLNPSGPGPCRTGSLGLLRDLADLHLLATFVEFTWEQVTQAACGARDEELIALGRSCAPALTGQLAWTRTRMRSESAQALLVG